MQKIKIASIDIKEGEKDGKPWKKYTITGEDKSAAATFDNNASSLKAGDVIEAEIILSGKYANIKTFKVVERASPEAQGKPIEEAKKAPLASRSDAIAEQVAVKAVVELVACGAIPQKHPLFGAVIDWCWDKLLPNAVKPALDEPPLKTSTVEIATGSNPPAKVSPIDLDWLRANLKTAKWTEPQVVSWLKSKANYQGLIFAPTFAGTINKLSPEQAKFLESEINSRVSMA